MDTTHLTDEELLSELETRYLAAASKNSPAIQQMLSRALDYLEQCA